MEDMKTCPKCGETKPEGHFNKHKHQCKECRAAVQRDYVARNREALNAKGRGRGDLKRLQYRLAKFDLTVEDYDQMLADQGGVCVICQGVNPSGRRLAVDHCHRTGRVRGLLCNRCNAGIAQFDDDTQVMLCAILYLASR